MADQRHIAILKRGTQVWNLWRQQNPTVVPDLSKANLSKADLSGANLSKADLSRSNLEGVDLSNVKMPYFIVNIAPPPPPELVFDWEYPVADLRNFDLSSANLSGSDFRNANFNGSNLSGVNFTGATNDYPMEFVDDIDAHP